METANNPMQRDRLVGSARVNADAANGALKPLDTRLADAAPTAERVAAVETTYQHIAEPRYQLAAGGQWNRRSSTAETVRIPIGVVSMAHRLTPLSRTGKPAFLRTGR